MRRMVSSLDALPGVLLPCFKTFVLNHWLACTLVMIATCLTRSFYKSTPSPSTPDNKAKDSSQTTSIQLNSLYNLKRQTHLKDSVVHPSPSSSKKNMRYQRNARRGKTKKTLVPTEPFCKQKTKQPYEAFLVLDLEGTCKLGTDFNYPNEIIEFPISFLQWSDRNEEGRAEILEVIDEFRSFVRPTWRPTLSDFCTELTGITQAQVDAAPKFSEVLTKVEEFLVKNGLIEEGTGARLKRYCWCSDGPWDVRDFFVKQCFISQVEMPPWIQGDVLDVRSTVLHWMISETTPGSKAPSVHIHGAKRPSLNISAQLKVLGLPEFEGRQHSGIDDTRNISKIVTELARRGVRLLPNTAIYPGRRWGWMGKHGQVLEDGLP